MEINKSVLAPVQMFQNERSEPGINKAEPGDLFYYIEKISVLVKKHGHSVSATGWIVGFQCEECGSILVSYKYLKLHETEYGHTATSVSDAPHALTTMKQIESSLVGSAANCFENEEDHPYLHINDNTILPKSSKSSLANSEIACYSEGEKLGENQCEQFHTMSSQHCETEHNYNEEKSDDHSIDELSKQEIVVSAHAVQQTLESTEDLADCVPLPTFRIDTVTVKEEDLSSEISDVPLVSEQSDSGLEAVSSEQDKKHNCDSCSKIFSSVKSLEVHRPYCQTKHKTSCKDETYPEETNTQSKKPSKGIVWCKECNKSFSSPGMLKRHSVVHTKETDLTCSLCSNVFGCKSSLRQHEKTCELKNEIQTEGEELDVQFSIQCSACKKQFSSKSGFSEHTCNENSKSKSKAKMQYVCPYCNRAYAIKGGLKYLKNHVKKHTGDDVYTCDKCGKTYSLQDVYRKHAKICGIPEDDKYVYKCTVCSKAFKARRSLLDHERMHTGELLYKCDDCGKHYLNKNNLRIHIKVVHSGEKPFMCSECGKCYSQRSILNKHLEIHQGKRKYECDICGKAFNVRGQLTHHKKVVHTDVRNFQCQKCPKAFKSMSDLKSHEFTHTGIRPYKCTLCSMAFKKRETLRLHQKTHTGLNMFECSICYQKFSVRATLMKHKKSHLMNSEEEMLKKL